MLGPRFWRTETGLRFWACGETAPRGRERGEHVSTDPWPEGERGESWLQAVPLKAAACDLVGTAHSCPLLLSPPLVPGNGPSPRHLASGDSPDPKWGDR